MAEREAGRTWNAIVRGLNADGVPVVGARPAKSGRPARWTAHRVQALIGYAPQPRPEWPTPPDDEPRRALRALAERPRLRGPMPPALRYQAALGAALRARPDLAEAHARGLLTARDVVAHHLRDLGSAAQ